MIAGTEIWKHADYTVTLRTIAAVLAIYAGLFVIIYGFKPKMVREERKTFWVIGLSWAVSVYIANILLAKAGLMSPLPWENNFLHTFVWIGFCLTWLYLGVRENRNMAAQFVMFSTFSLIVKVAEHLLFKTWDLDHFFHVFPGNPAYVLGWSLADGLYPPITFYGLRVVGRWVDGLIVL